MSSDVDEKNSTLPSLDYHPQSLRGVVRLSRRLQAEYLEFWGVLPLRIDPTVAWVGAWGDVDSQALEDLMLLFERPVELVCVNEDEARATIRRVYADESVTARGVIEGLGGGDGEAVDIEIALDDLVHQANEAPVIKLVNLLVLEALDARASDVHLEAYADGLRVRYRIDGVLQDGPAPPANLAAAVVSRLKIMADLDVAERRLPQDGRIRLRLQNRDVDVRVSTLPTLKGESVVLRLLDKDRGRMTLTDLGMSAELLSRFHHALSRPNGIVLVTGPTGSGKTTTLYAAVEYLRTGREKILSVEDPVEYQLEGVPQVAVNDRIGLSFATALRALLRQDPDVMLIGEIRDTETAEIAAQAALTGHLVLSTLHTNDAPGALTRLLDLGVPPYLISSTVEAVVGQRLVRKICRSCLDFRPVVPGEVSESSAVGVSELPFGRGCEMCRGSGYLGRTGIYELLPLTDSLRGLIMRRGSAAEVRAAAALAGVSTMRDDAWRLVRSGVTTMEEIERATRSASELLS